MPRSPIVALQRRPSIVPTGRRHPSHLHGHPESVVDIRPSPNAEEVSRDNAGTVECQSRLKACTVIQVETRSRRIGPKAGQGTAVAGLAPLAEVRGVQPSRRSGAAARRVQRSPQRPSLSARDAPTPRRTSEVLGETSPDLDRCPASVTWSSPTLPRLFGTSRSSSGPKRGVSADSVVHGHWRW